MFITGRKPVLKLIRGPLRHAILQVSMAISADSPTEKPQNRHFWPIFRPLYTDPPLPDFHKVLRYMHITDMCLVLVWCKSVLNNTTTTTVLRPFVRDYPGEPVPEETLTHPPSWSSSILNQLLPSATIHSILLVQITCLAIFLHNLLPCPLWSTSWSGASTSYSIHFFTQSVSSFHCTCLYHRNLFCCSINIISIGSQSKLEAMRQCKPPPRHVLPVPLSGESLWMNVC